MRDNVLRAVLIIFLLTFGMAINHVSEVAVWLLPERLLFDCSTLSPDQQAVVHKHGLRAIGIWKKCK
jgi:hypothetical protein